MKGKSASEQLLFGDINGYGFDGDISRGKMPDIRANTMTDMTHTGRRHNDGHADFRNSAQMPGIASSGWGDTV